MHAEKLGMGIKLLSTILSLFIRIVPHYTVDIITIIIIFFFVINSNALPESMEEMLFHTANTEEAIAEIESLGGRVTLVLGDELVVAKVPRELIARKTSFASASPHIASSASLETLTFVQAYYNAREEMAKSPQPPPQSWTDKTPPMVLPQESTFPSEADSPYRQTLIGYIAVGIIIVSSPREPCN